MSDWVHNDDPLECGVRLPASSINLWRKPALVADWRAGWKLRDLAVKYGVSHETARKWTECLSRKVGSSRRPRRNGEAHGQA